MSNKPIIDPLTKKVLTRKVDSLRRKPPIKELVEMGYGELTDQSMKHKIKLEWKLNAAAQRDKVFKLSVDDKTVYIDLEELTYYTRSMFQ